MYLNIWFAMTILIVSIGLIVIGITVYIRSDKYMINDKDSILSKVHSFILSYFSKKDIIIFLVPMLFIAGYSNMSKCEKKNSATMVQVDSIVEETDEEKVSLVGVVNNVEEKENTFLIFLKTDLSSYKLKDNKIEIGSNTTKKLYNDLVLVYIDKKNYEGVHIGNVIRGIGKVYAFEHATNEGGFDEYDYYVKEKNCGCKFFLDDIKIMDGKRDYKQRLLDIRTKFKSTYEKVLSKKDSATISAMILGEKSNLDDEVSDLYKKNGIAHILAISGLHISIIGMGLFNLLRRTRFDVYLNVLFCMTIVILYGLMTGSSIATLRAVIMLSASFFSIIVGRKYDMFSALSLSALLILIINPYQLFSCGMILSFMAVFSIEVIYPILSKLFVLDKKKKTILNDEKLYIDEETGEYVDSRFIISVFDMFDKLKGFIKESLLVSTSVNIMTLPIILYYYFEFSLMSFFINILVIPLMTLLIILAILACIGGMICNFLGVFFAGSVHFILCFYELLCRIGEKISILNILSGYPFWIWIIIYYVFVLIFLIKPKKKRIVIVVIGAFLLLGMGKILSFFTSEVNTTMLDVGQGDGIYLKIAHNKVIMIDGGSSSKKNIAKYTLVPFLKYHGDNTIDYQVITHSDSDHISGVMELIEGEEVTIRNLILPYVAEDKKDENYKKLESLAREKHVKISYIKKGDKLNLGEKEHSIECLHPSKDYNSESVNGYSTVLLYQYKEFDMLFTGDLEEDGEKLVGGQLKDISKKIDVLKVAHHGSKNSSTDEFLKVCNPKYAIISAGKNNRYNHPHEETLNRLKDNDIKYYVTKEKGRILITTDGKKIKIKNGL